jgi:hypothetical protein
MKATYTQLAAALTLTFGIAACVPSTPAPAPAPAPVARPAPAPARPAPTVTTPAPAGTDWMDFPATAGGWSFTTFPIGSQAIFRGPAGQDTGLAISCNAQSRQITLLRPGRSNRALAMRILTETASRTGTAEPVAEQFAGVILRLDPRDPMLDAMAISKGRFAVEVEGMPTLYLPSWAEVSRVIEDCR